ncbi:MAG: squalene/phytoene synthase family protein [Verrucomicrobiota bacterium]|jgi:phytoene synthase|nr:squalene/phytoene synthase family protein [Verrucomicrobiota bacterium]MEE2812916.1 squalene/phytoene synthase family protein [Verrucomicrobiota bacterium]
MSEVSAAESGEQITQRSASNLALSFVALEKPRRKAMTTLYAFCREVDDVADEESSPLESRRVSLQEWREDVQKACEGGVPRKSLVLELQPVIERYGLQFEHFDALIKGLESDLEQDRIETFEDLDLYCYRVASAVGLLSVEVFGYRDTACQQYMVELGKALQYTNILRDIGNDAERGRIYIPQEAMERFGVDPRSILSGKYSTAFYNLAEEMSGLARCHYKKTAALLPDGDRRSMVSGECMAAVYWRILCAIEKTRFRAVLDPKPLKLSKITKLSILFGVWTRSFLGSSKPNYGQD